MTRYKKEGFRKAFVGDDGVRRVAPVFVKSLAYRRPVFLIGVVVCNG